VSVQSAVDRVAFLSGAFAAPPAPPPAPPAPPPAPTAPATPFAGALEQAMDTAPAGRGSQAPASGRHPHLAGDLDADPDLLARLEALAAQRGERWTVTSGHRSLAEQQRLWDGRHSNPFPVARPGSSLHHSGRAADVTVGGRPIQDVVPAAELRRAGLVPLAGDAVHVELPRAS